MAYNKRINDEDLPGNYVDGSVLLHTDMNKLETLTREGINANYEDIQKLQDGTTVINYATNAGSAETSSALDSATLSTYDEETLQNNDAKVPTSKQVKEYVDAAVSGLTSDYPDLTNKPSINGVTLVGNKTSADLGIPDDIPLYYFDGINNASNVAMINEICTKYDNGEGVHFVGKFADGELNQVFEAPINITKYGTGDDNWASFISDPIPWLDHTTTPAKVRYCSYALNLTGTWGNYTAVSQYRLDDFVPLTAETDPVFSASAAASITASDITNWDKQSDWSQSSTTAADYIKNKPAIEKGTGTDAVKEGDLSSNTANGTYAHAEGYSTAANGAGAHSEGWLTTASQTYSHAEGFSTTASGIASHAEGAGTKSSSTSQHAQGQFNIEDSNATYAHIVGNGTSDVARSNAHTLDWSGNAWFEGDVYVGSTSGTNKDAGSKKLATEDYANSVVPQKATLPTAAGTNEGVIFQYTGTTDANYTNGYFYKCVSDGATPTPTYSWERVDVQPNSGGSNDIIILDHTQYTNRQVTLVGLKKGIYMWDDLSSELKVKFSSSDDTYTSVDLRGTLSFTVIQDIDINSTDILFVVTPVTYFDDTNKKSVVKEIKCYRSATGQAGLAWGNSVLFNGIGNGTGQETNVNSKLTFTSYLPKSSIVPTVDGELTNKKYVDDNSLKEINYNDYQDVDDYKFVDLLSGIISDGTEVIYKTGTFTVREANYGTNTKTLGTGILLIEGNGVDTANCTFYGNSVNATFNLFNETDAETGDDYTVYNNYSESGSGGTVTDVQVDGTSILSSGVANLLTNTAYNASTNKIATMSDIPSIPQAPNVIILTESAYNALTTYADNTEYHIIEG